VKAFIIERYGSDSGRLAEMPVPALRENDVLVQIHAASVNPVDFKIRDGKLKAVVPYRLPLILGNDFSGVVVEVGAAVRAFKPGDEIYARADKDRIGSFAEFIAIQADSVAPKPASLSMEEAASIPLVALTALQAFERAGLTAGQKGADPCGFRWRGNTRHTAGETPWAPSWRRPRAPRMSRG
jgi:alcohol dehydrogenase